LATLKKIKIDKDNQQNKPGFNDLNLFGKGMAQKNTPIQYNVIEK
jgi:hypothetical protein